MPRFSAFDDTQAVKAARRLLEFVVGHGKDVLPAREGPRPAMSDTLPHFQLDQWPDQRRIADLLARASKFPNVVIRQSRMASLDTAALALDDEHAVGPAEAFIDLPEFCHLLGPPQGGAHLTLPPTVIASLVELGWAEPHLAAKS